MTMPQDWTDARQIQDPRSTLDDWSQPEADDASPYQAINDRRARLESPETLRLARAL
jgi:hypothetical protein